MDADLVSNASSIALGVSAVVVVIVASWGINAWRRELKGKAKYELARSLIVVCRKIQAAFEWARFPITLSGEFSERPQLENELPETSKVLNEMWGRGQRLKPLMEYLRELQELAWESEAVLDEEASNKVNEVRRLLQQKYAQLRSGIDAYFELRREQVEGRDVVSQQEFMRGLRHEIYGTTKDEFHKEVDTSTGELASLLKRYLG